MYSCVQMHEIHEIKLYGFSGIGRLISVLGYFAFILTNYCGTIVQDDRIYNCNDFTKDF